MHRLCAIAPFAMTGCAAVFGIGDPEPETPPPSCIVSGLDLCARQEPNGPITFASNVQIDTALDCSIVLFDPDGGSRCVVYATDLTVSGTLFATGPRPLVLAARGTIVVDGIVDVSSYENGGIGAAANDAACTINQEPDQTQNGGSGGAGGSFIGKGGGGGTGTANLAAGAAGDAVGAPTRPRGGCPGGRNAGFPTNEGGAGGGAVVLVAGGAIEVSTSAKILACGAGGKGAQATGGFGPKSGAGGGSGGFVRFSAPLVTISGIVKATGGGGGEGDDDQATMGGSPGADGASTSAGGSGLNVRGGDGGSGASGTVVNGANGSNATASSAAAAGGGGGGGIGMITIDSENSPDTSGATISPPPK